MGDVSALRAVFCASCPVATGPLRCRQRRPWVEAGAEAVAEAEQYLAEESELARRQADKTHSRNSAGFWLFPPFLLASVYKAAAGFVNDASCLAELREACFRQG